MVGSYVAAGLLACLTIRVFFELQDSGPESAIRRFNDAIRDHDAESIRKLTTEPLEGDATRAMLAKLDAWDSDGATMQVTLMERSGDEVRAVVVFSLPKGTSSAMIWVVERRGKMWLVDANKTATILWDNLGLGNPYRH